MNSGKILKALFLTMSELFLIIGAITIGISLNESSSIHWGSLIFVGGAVTVRVLFE